MIPQDLTVLNTVEARLHRLRKTVLNSARIISDGMANHGFRKWRALFVTLTYRDDVEWQAGHVAAYIKAVTAWAARQDVRLRYVWVAEMTKRGRPHYHVMIWLPRHLQLPMSDKRGWWPHGMTNTAVARKAVGYMAKYASKLDSKEGKFPKGMRLHGVGGLSAAGRGEVRWWNLPKWARERWPLSEGYALRRVPGGGVQHVLTGEHERSSYTRSIFVTLEGARCVVFRKIDSLVELPKWLLELKSAAAEKIARVPRFFTADVLRKFEVEREYDSIAQREGEAPAYGGMSRMDWLMSLPPSLRFQPDTANVVDWSLPGWAGLRRSAC